MSDKELIQIAHKARAMSYSPYSGFSVGAALLCKSGKVYMGCNIENSAYSPSNCAERTAFFTAVCAGEREFEKIAVVGAKHGESAEAPCAPCGVCRQVMLEFCDPEIFSVVLQNGNDTRSYLLKELIPASFTSDNLK